MIKKLLLLFLIAMNVNLWAQCEISAFIEDTRTRDAKILALREILANPDDPDYYEGIIPQDRIDPYLQKLSAIYENPNNIPFIDSLFNEFNFHVNPSENYNYYTPYRSMYLEVDKSADWYNNFRNTGISNVQELDSLINYYQFDIDPFFGYGGTFIFELESQFDVINIRGIKDEFEAIEGVVFAEPIDEPSEYDYYTGIYYYISTDYGGGSAELCDITVNGNVFTFTLYGGDCMAGCMYEVSWDVIVSEDCDQVTLSADYLQKENPLQVYPNPATDFITLHPIPENLSEIYIYDINGRMIHSQKDDFSNIDISNLPSGLYFLKLFDDSGKIQQLKFIIAMQNTQK